MSPKLSFEMSPKLSFDGETSSHSKPFVQRDLTKSKLVPSTFFFYFSTNSVYCLIDLELSSRVNPSRDTSFYTCLSSETQ